jgi:CDP-glucose 4,6-dehydratase
MRVDAEFWAGRRVLVTGHTGFKGAWLTLWLSSLGAEVVGLARTPAQEQSAFTVIGAGADAESLEADLVDRAAVTEAVRHADPEVLIHLAAQPFVQRSFRDPYATWQVNVLGTLNLLEASRGADRLRAAIMVTSDRSYDDRGGPAFRPLVETDPLGGQDPYASSKAAAELAVNAWRASFFERDPGGPQVATARTGNVIGGGDWGESRLIPDIVRAAERGEPISVRNPEAVRAWQHVLAPLAGYLGLAQKLAGGPGFDEAWNFGPPLDDARSVRWVTERVSELWPEPLDWELDPSPYPPEALRSALDSAKARRRLAWRSPWALDEALRRTVEWHVGLRDGADMRALTLAQIEAFTEAAAGAPGPA